MSNCIKSITIGNVPENSTVPTYYGSSRGTTPVNIHYTYGPPSAEGPYMIEVTSEQMSYGKIDHRNREQRRADAKKEKKLIERKRYVTTTKKQ